MRVKTVAKKSQAKVKIIENIDRKIPLYDIAAAEGLEYEELLTKIEEIVYSGIKLNIDYFIEEEMDEDHVLDIYDYFMESDTDDVEAAENELPRWPIKLLPSPLLNSILLFTRMFSLVFCKFL